MLKETAQILCLKGTGTGAHLVEPFTESFAEQPLPNCSCYDMPSKRPKVRTAYHLLEVVRLGVHRTIQELSVNVTKANVQASGLNVDYLAALHAVPFRELLDPAVLLYVCSVRAGSKDEAYAAVVLAVSVVRLCGKKGRDGVIEDYHLLLGHIVPTA